MRRKHLPLVKLSLGAIVLLLLGVGLFHVAGQHDPVLALKDYLTEGVSPSLFLALMAVMPIFGAPITLFLVLVGMKFGTVEGILISSLTMFFHLLCTHYLVHSFLRGPIINLLHRFNLPVPPRGSTPSTWQAFVFMLIPGLPYAAKNVLLALSGISAFPYLTVSWTTQFGFSLPFIVLGGAVIQLDRVFIILAACFFALVLLIQYFFRRRLRNIEGKLDRATSNGDEPPADKPR